MICPGCRQELDAVTIYRAINATECWAVVADGDTFRLEYTETDEENGDNGATIICRNCDHPLKALEDLYPAFDEEPIPADYLAADDEEDEPLHPGA